MRAGIPNAKARERTITLYVDTARFMRVIGIHTKNDVHILLVDRRGSTIVWRMTGSFDAAKGGELAQALETYLRRAEVPQRVKVRRICRSLGRTRATTGHVGPGRQDRVGLADLFGPLAPV